MEKEPEWVVIDGKFQLREFTKYRSDAMKRMHDAMHTVQLTDVDDVERETHDARVMVEQLRNAAAECNISELGRVAHKLGEEMLYLSAVVKYGEIDTPGRVDTIMDELNNDIKSIIRESATVCACDAEQPGLEFHLGQPRIRDVRDAPVYVL